MPSTVASSSRSQYEEAVPANACVRPARIRQTSRGFGAAPGVERLEWDPERVQLARDVVIGTHE